MVLRPKDHQYHEICLSCLKNLNDNSYLEKVILILFNFNKYIVMINLIYYRVYLDHLLHLVMFVYYNHL